MKIGITRETFPGERRVSIIPDTIPTLTKAGAEVIVETGAGLEADYPDNLYTEKGARISANRSEIYSESDIVLQVRALGANPEAGKSDLDLMHSGQIIIGLSEPLTEVGSAQELANKGIVHFSMELIPRITRA